MAKDRTLLRGGHPHKSLPDLDVLGFVTMDGHEGGIKVDVSELGFAGDLPGMYPFNDLAEIGKIILLWVRIFAGNNRSLQMGKVEIVIWWGSKHQAKIHRVVQVGSQFEAINF